jgi:hypothetical protein
MQAIASEFNGTLKTYERNRFNDTLKSLLVRTTSKASNTLIDHYFSLFPLFTGKRLDYQEWAKALALINSGKHQTKEGIQTFLNAKKTMNTQRSSWNPLYAKAGLPCLIKGELETSYYFLYLCFP